MAPYTQLPWFGVKDQVFTKIQRMAGFDALIYPGFDTRMKASEEDMLANADACLKPMGSLKPMLPVPAGSQWAGSLKELYENAGYDRFWHRAGQGGFRPSAGAEGRRGQPAAGLGSCEGRYDTGRLCQGS